MLEYSYRWLSVWFQMSTIQAMQTLGRWRCILDSRWKIEEVVIAYASTRDESARWGRVGIKWLFPAVFIVWCSARCLVFPFVIVPFVIVLDATEERSESSCRWVKQKCRRWCNVPCRLGLRLKKLQRSMTLQRDGVVVLSCEVNLVWFLGCAAYRLKLDSPG